VTEKRGNLTLFLPHEQEITAVVAGVPNVGILRRLLGATITGRRILPNNCTQSTGRY